MTNTMVDLRREVAKRLRDTLHGREIDTMEMGMPELPHMLGIVTLGAIPTHKAKKGSLLDSDHEFWSAYYKNVDTDGKAEREIESAVRLLREDGIFRPSTPYGEEAGIWYCEVNYTDETDDQMLTVCADCGETIPTEPELNHRDGVYTLEFALDCSECDFSGKYETHVSRK